jgi:hypothetical protein
MGHRFRHQFKPCQEELDPRVVPSFLANDKVLQPFFAFGGQKMRSLFGLMTLAVVLPLALRNDSDVPIPLGEASVGIPDSPGAAFAVSRSARQWAPHFVGEQQTEVEISKLIGELGNSDFKVRENATNRLLDIGLPALDALGQASEKGNAESRGRAGSIAKDIRAANLITLVKGIEFKLIVEKEWMMPESGEKKELQIALEFKNTTDTVYRLKLYGAIKVIIDDVMPAPLLPDERFKTADVTQPPVTPPLAKNQSYRLLCRGQILNVKNQRATLKLHSPFSLSLLAQSTIAKGKTYHFGLVYENKKQADDGGAPYWEGKAETPLATVTIK